MYVNDISLDPENRVLSKLMYISYRYSGTLSFPEAQDTKATQRLFNCEMLSQLADDNAENVFKTLPCNGGFKSVRERESPSDDDDDYSSVGCRLRTPHRSRTLLELLGTQLGFMKGKERVHALP